MSGAELRRFVAVGDSFTEGLDDLRPDGSLRGWADRVADVLSEASPGFQYANLAVRSRRIDSIVGEQVPRALEMEADLVTIAAGGNDVIGMRVDVEDVARQLDEAVGALTASGAVTVVFAGFNPRRQLPPGALVAGRIGRFNAHVRRIAIRHGAILVDLWPMRELDDLRMWSPDRLHLSEVGHLLVAGVVLERLGHPVPEGWPPPSDRGRRWLRTGSVREQLGWTRDHMLPWAVRQARGQAMGDGRSAKYPDLREWRPAS